MSDANSEDMSRFSHLNWAAFPDQRFVSVMRYPLIGPEAMGKLTQALMAEMKDNEVTGMGDGHDFHLTCYSYGTANQGPVAFDMFQNREAFNKVFELNSRIHNGLGLKFETELYLLDHGSVEGLGHIVGNGPYKPDLF